MPTATASVTPAAPPVRRGLFAGGQPLDIAQLDWAAEPMDVSLGPGAAEPSAGAR